MVLSSQSKRLPVVRSGALLLAAQRLPAPILFLSHIRLSGHITGVLDTDELGLLTLFAPTNWAFDRTFATYPGLDELLLGDPALLETVLLYHVVAAEVLPIDIPEEGVEVTTAGGETFIAFRECHMWGWWCYVGIQDGSLDVTWVTGFNRFATNGVTHLIDKVLIPPSLAEAVEGLRPV